MIPVVLLCGKAGSGKDTVGAHLARQFNGVCIGLADPLKLLVQELFGFSTASLFGESERRNDTVTPNKAVVDRFFDHFGESWCCKLFGDPPNSYRASQHLRELRLKTARICRDEPLSARYALQIVGTEWGRSIDTTVWSRYAMDTARQLLSGGWVIRDRSIGISPAKFNGYDCVIICDGRFRSEIIDIKSQGGVAIHISRPSEINADMTHSSETELDHIPKVFFDATIKNSHDVEYLKQRAEFTMHKVFNV